MWLWRRLQRGRHHSRILVLLHVGSERIGNSLRVHRDRYLCRGRLSFDARCPVRTGNQTRRVVMTPFLGGIVYARRCVSQLSCGAVRTLQSSMIANATLTNWTPWPRKLTTG